MSYIYRSSRYFQEIDRPFNSLADAVKAALESLEGDADYPDSIRKDDEILWIQPRPLKVRESLVVFAESNGVDLPESYL